MKKDSKPTGSESACYMDTIAAIAEVVTEAVQSAANSVEQDHKRANAEAELQKECGEQWRN